jgi:hypothetical protein
VENSDAYSIIKALMKKKLFDFQHQEFIEWLYRLQSKGQITEEEIKDLLQLAYQLKIFDLLISEQCVPAFN